MYTPKNKIQTNLFTGGGEYTFTNGAPYSGFYWKNDKGDIFTGRTPQSPPATRLIPLKANKDSVVKDVNNTLLYAGGVPINDLESSANNLEYTSELLTRDFNTYTRVIGINNPKKIPVQTYPIPNSSDYQVGAFLRYFLFKANDNKFLEVDKITYDNIVKRSVEWLWQVYRPFTILWTIRGSQTRVENINKNITLLTQKRLGISTGLTEFLKGNYTQYLLSASPSTQTPSSRTTPNTSRTSPSSTSSPPPSSGGGGGY